MIQGKPSDLATDDPQCCQYWPNGHADDCPTVVASEALDGDESDTRNFQHITQFEGHFDRLGSRSTDGSISITFGVPKPEKYNAMPVTDYPGRVFRVTVEMLVFDGFGVDD